MSAEHVQVDVAREGDLWVARVDGVAGGLSASDLDTLQQDVVSALRFLFTPHVPAPIYRYAPAGLAQRVAITGDLYHPEIPASAVRITRPGPWGNPFRVAEHGREQALELFRAYLEGRPDLVARARRELAGRDLACWCKPGQACHGDIWLEILGLG